MANGAYVEQIPAKFPRMGMATLAVGNFRSTLILAAFVVEGGDAK